MRVTTSTVDHIKTTKRTNVKTIFVASGGVHSASISPDVPEIVASALSPSGKYLVVLREIGDSKAPDGKKRFVEIWAEDKLQVIQDVTAVHGPFYTDGAIGIRLVIYVLTFGISDQEYLSSLSFSPSETKVVYTAEAMEGQSDADPFAKFRFVPDFGESYSGKKHPSVFLFDWGVQEKPTTARVAIEEPDAQTPKLLLGHPVFASENRIFAVGYEYYPDGRLLGVIYCPNRAAVLLDIALPDSLGDGKEKELRCSSSRLTSADVSCRSPRILRDTDGSASHVVWVSNPAGGPHATCSSLHARNIETGETRTLVASVWDPKPKEFPGLFLNTLPVSPFVRITSRPWIVLSSTWRSRSTILLVSLDDGTVKDLTLDDEHGIYYSWSLLCTDGGNQLVATRSSPTHPPELLLGHVDDGAHVHWRVLSSPDISVDCECSIVLELCTI